MKRLWGQLWTLSGFGLLFSFLSFLFVASVGGRSDGRKIPFLADLAESGCNVSYNSKTTGSLWGDTWCRRFRRPGQVRVL